MSHTFRRRAYDAGMALDAELFSTQVWHCESRIEADRCLGSGVAIAVGGAPAVVTGIGAPAAALGISYYEFDLADLLLFCRHANRDDEEALAAALTDPSAEPDELVAVAETLRETLAQEQVRLTTIRHARACLAS
jgi:hypothetical protein